MRGLMGQCAGRDTHQDGDQIGMEGSIAEMMEIRGSRAPRIRMELKESSLKDSLFNFVGHCKHPGSIIRIGFFE